MKGDFLKTLNVFRVKHEPEILMSMGLAGLTFSVIWGIKSTIKAVELCSKRKEELKVDKLSTKEVIKTTWKLYIPVVASTVVSIPCIIAGNRVSSKRNAALAAAYTMSETALKEYQSKTKELIGEKKEQEIKNAIAQDQVNKTEDKQIKEIVFNDENEQLFLDPLSGRYFKSTWNNIQKIVNELNEQALSSVTGFYSLNDFYDRIGLDHTILGDEVGWGVPGFCPGCQLMKINMSTAKTKDDKPCGCVDYIYRPVPLN